MTFGDDVLRLAQAVLQHLALITTDLPGLLLPLRVVTQRERIVAERGDRVFPAPLREVTRGHDHGERS